MAQTSTKNNPILKIGGAWFWLLIVVVAIAGVLLLRYVTPFGLGLFNDSDAYIGGAQNILAGHGYTRLAGDGTYKPVTNNPPMYPFVLLPVLLAGFQPLRAAWWVAAVLFAVNIGLVGFIVRRITGSAILGLVGAVLFPISQTFLYVHTLALSEPVFLANYLLSLFFLAGYFENDNKVWIILAGVTASFTYLARYVGVSLYGTAILALFVFSSGWKKRLNGILLFLAGGLPAVAVWTVRNFLASGNAANRTILYHPIPAQKIMDGLYNFWVWLLPERFGLIDKLLPFWNVLFFVLLAGLVAGIIWGILFLSRKTISAGNGSFRLILIIGLQAVLFLATLVFTLTFLDASPIFEPRIIMPFLICVFFLIFAFLAWLWQRKIWLTKAATIVLILALAASFVEDTKGFVHDLHLAGQGYAASSWVNSDTIQAVRALPDVLIYSNKIMAISLLTDRSAYILPSPTNPATVTYRTDYLSEVNKVRQRVLAQKAVMVIFDYRNLDDPLAGQWMHDLTDGIPMIKEYGDGAIFGILPK
jgi:hypothetical protein